MIMADRVAIVTGASRGIGRGVAVALGREKWMVAVNFAVHADAASETVSDIEKAGGRAVALQADISAAADRRRLVEETLTHFGRIDLLVNNAGVAPNVRADILEASEESFDRLIDINLKGPYFLTQLAARQMIKQAEGERQTQQAKHAITLGSPLPTLPSPSGMIVTISSISAYTASVNRGDYCIAKAGLGMMTALYAARLAEYGINVYEIRPGVMATDMTRPVKDKYDELIAAGLTPIQRWGQPDDVGKAVVAIAGGLLPFSTGEVINVDGGFHLRRL
jgi:3-oxoacyl-[acyl-carrier protein] reductase